MTAQKQPWFRFYGETSHDAKLRRVALKTGQHYLMVFGAWSVLLCLASNSPERGKLMLTETVPYLLEEILDELKLDFEAGQAIVDEFITLEMLHIEGETYVISHWDKRQYAAQCSSAERVRRFRERQKQNANEAAGSDNDTNPPEDNSNVTGDAEGSVTGSVTGNGLKRSESTESTESSLSQNTRMREDRIETATVADQDGQAQTVREVILDLHGVYDLPAEIVDPLGAEIAQSVAAGHPRQLISQAYEEALDRARGPVGPYARAILKNWAANGPPGKGVYGEPERIRKSKRETNGYSGRGSGRRRESAISSLSGRAIDDPIKEIFDPKTRETYYIDRTTNERVTDPAAVIH